MSVIRFWGDLHGEFGHLRETADVAAHVQVGDFGFYPDAMRAWKPLGAPVYFCRGNHEWHPDLDYRGSTAPVEVAEGLWYVPSGVVVSVGGVRVGFCGGAGSIDYAYRTKGKSWHPELEVTRPEEVDALLSREVDIIVTHTPPQSIIDRHFPGPKPNFGQSPDWFDPSALEVERLLGMSRDHWFCGHMHRKVYDAATNLRILDIGESVDVPCR